jgi:hypothetical protein
MGKKRKVYKFLVRKPEGNRPLGRPRCRWKNNIKIVLKKQNWEAWVAFFRLKIGPSNGTL